MSPPVTHRLPAALQPWHAWLGWFDAELAEALGDLVRRLAPLAGPAQAAAGRQQTEPDGLGDLRTQGRYERLLMSEWLLADELPHEFLRRAAASEHLFLAPSLRSTPSDRHVVAIFDAGPQQLGAPRVAHLAVLILLARRAEQLGGTLRWGLLQQPGQLHSMDGVSSLKKLLQARSLHAVDATAVSLWRDALAAEAPSPDPAECWWIGGPKGPHAQAPLRHERRLELRQAWSGPMLHATLLLPTQQRHCDLPLPADLHVGALLNGQFDKAQADPQRKATARARTDRSLSLTRRPIIAVDGSHVAAFPMDAAGVLVVRPRRRASRDVPRVKVHEQLWVAGRSLVAARLSDKSVQGLVLDEHHLTFWQIPGLWERPRPSSEDLAVAIATAAAMPLVVLEADRKRSPCVLVVDERKRLIVWHRGEEQHERVSGPSCIAEQVMAAVHGDPDQLFYAFLKDGSLWLHGLSWSGWALSPMAQPIRLLPVQPLASGLTPMFLCVHRADRRIVPQAYAAQTRQSAQSKIWTLEADFGPQGLLGSRPADGSRQRIAIEVPAGQRVVGLVCRSRHEPPEPRLLVMSSDRKTLILASDGRRKPVFSTTGGIAQAVVCPRTGRVAIITEDRSLHFIEGVSGEVIARLDHDDAAADMRSQASQTPSAHQEPQTPDSAPSPAPSPAPAPTAAAAAAATETTTPAPPPAPAPLTPEVQP